MIAVFLFRYCYLAQYCLACIINLDFKVAKGFCWIGNCFIFVLARPDVLKTAPSHVFCLQETSFFFDVTATQRAVCAASFLVPKREKISERTEMKDSPVYQLDLLRFPEAGWG